MTPPTPPPPPPPPHHTDACIQDAARYGFCDHTRLTASPHLVYRHDIHLYVARQAREYAAWVSLTLLILGEILLFTSTSTPRALLITPALALAWSGLFASGLPAPFVADPARTLPPDVQER